MDVDKKLQECEHNDFDIYARRDIHFFCICTIRLEEEMDITA